MKKLLLCLVTILGILIINIGRAQAASLTLSPDSGLAGSSFTITAGNDFKLDQPVIVKWDSDGLTVSNSQTDGSGGYSSSAQVPVGASVGSHTVKVTGPGPDVMLMYGPKYYWFSYFFPRALAAEDIIATKNFTVTAPPVTPPVETPPPVTPPVETPVADTNTAPANTSTQGSSSNTESTVQSPVTSNQVTAEPVAPTVTPEPTVQTKSTNEVKEEAKVCYFPWWLWLVLILITAVNLALFWLRYWKKEKQKE